VGLALDTEGRGDLAFNDQTAAGLERAREDFKLATFEEELMPVPAIQRSTFEVIDRLASRQLDLICGNGFAFSDAIAAVAPSYPATNFVMIDGFIPDLTAESNIAAVSFKEHEGSFLAGAAAAMRSVDKHVAFIGGVAGFGLIEKFEAGYAEGALAAGAASVERRYISVFPDFSGFGDAARAYDLAMELYGSGVDVIYHAAGGSGAGLFQAAVDYSAAEGTHVWAIGVDSDQWLAFPEAQAHILTSMLKRTDNALHDNVAAEVAGTFTGGYQVLGLAEDGVGYSTSGGHVAPYIGELEEYRAAIEAGLIDVPEVP
jgi:basic membrane protein A